MNIKSKFIMSLLLILLAGLFGCSSDDKSDDYEILSEFGSWQTGPDACFTASVAAVSTYPYIEVWLLSASNSSVWEEWENLDLIKYKHDLQKSDLPKQEYSEGEIVSFKIKKYRMRYNLWGYSEGIHVDCEIESCE